MRRSQLACFLALLVVSNGATLEVESSAELANLPFVRFALPDLHDKIHDSHEAFLQTEVKMAWTTARQPASPAALPATAATVVPTEPTSVLSEVLEPQVVAAKQMAVPPVAQAPPTDVAVTAAPAAQAQSPLTPVSRQAPPAPQVAMATPAPGQVVTQPQAVQVSSPAQVGPQAVQAETKQPPAQMAPVTPPTAVPVVPAATVAAAATSVAQTSSKAAKKVSPTTRLAASFSLALIVKVLCMLSNVACHVSPLPRVQQFHKLGDTGEADSAPLMSILYSGTQWVFYGTFAYCMTGKSGFLALVYANITGAVLGVYYVWGFQNNCRDQKALQQLQLYCRAAAFMVFLQFLAIWGLSCSSALFFSGLMASLSSIIGAFSLCSTLPKVIKTQCSASINVELLIVGICSSVLWVSCGVMLWDVWILLPTLFGLVIQLACGLFVLLFPREEQGDLIHLPSRSPICSWVLPRDCGQQLEDSTERAPRRALAGRAGAAAAQIRAALRASESAGRPQDYGSTASAGAGTGGTC